MKLDKTQLFILPPPPIFDYLWNFLPMEANKEDWKDAQLSFADVWNRGLESIMGKPAVIEVITAFSWIH